jgi:F-type H+-transporting ATPase subunit c
MQKMTQWISVATLATFALFISDTALAAAPSEAQGFIGIGAGLAIGLAVLGGAIGQGLAARAVLESIARNPQASGKLNAPFFIGMALIESLVIFAWLMAFFLNGHLGA